MPRRPVVLLLLPLALTGAVGLHPPAAFHHPPSPRPWHHCRRRPLPPVWSSGGSPSGAALSDAPAAPAAAPSSALMGASQGNGGEVVTGVNIFCSDRFLEHKARVYHPENGFRVSVPAKALAGVEGVRMKEPGVSLEEALEAVKAVHDPDYVAKIKALSERGGGFLDYDTYANYASYECCLLASAAWMDAARHTVLGDSSAPIDANERPPTRRPSFALARPPGHHATRAQAGGFCIFNHCIVAAKYALDHLGCRRVAILDWDAHHGNGNEALARELPGIAYASLHQQDAFPNTGLDPTDQGPLGNILNVPIPAYTDARAYLSLLEKRVLPFLKSFEPDLLIVSAGYDSLVDDPLAQLALLPADFTVIVEKLKQLFGSNIMFGLEGGYDPEMVAAAVQATLAPFLPPVADRAAGAGEAPASTFYHGETMASTHNDDQALVICPICGQQYGEPVGNPPPACKICEDDRQWTPGTGQDWTSLEEMKRTHRNEITQLEAGVHSVQTTRKFGIGQRCILVQASGGNVLWDCISLVDDDTIAAVEELGGVAKIVVSHPHFLGACLSWSNALPTRPPVYLHATDRDWVTRPDTEGSSPRYVFWEGDELALGEGLRAVRLGGHFPGSAVLLLANCAEDGETVAFTSDTILPVPHREWVSFMFSFPNLLPLPDFEVRRIRNTVAAWPEAFARLYGPFASSVIKGKAKEAVLESAQRYLDALGGKYHGEQQA